MSEPRRIAKIESQATWPAALAVLSPEDRTAVLAAAVIQQDDQVAMQLVRMVQLVELLAEECRREDQRVVLAALRGSARRLALLVE